MIVQIPKAIVTEARRLAVETNLRLYVVGGLAEAIADHDEDSWADLSDWDLIVVGDGEAYEVYERDVLQSDCPFDDGPEEPTRSRTRFNGMRYIFANRPNIDVLWHYDVADYMNKQDKGPGIVVDPVTGKVFAPVHMFAQRIDLRVKDERGESPFNMITLQPREYLDRAEPEARRIISLMTQGGRDGAFRPGANVVELVAGDRVVGEFVYDHVPAPKPAPPPEPVPPPPSAVEMVEYTGRWYDSDPPVTVRVPSVASDETIAIAIAQEFLSQGRVPRGRAAVKLWPGPEHNSGYGLGPRARTVEAKGSERLGELYTLGKQGVGLVTMSGRWATESKDRNVTFKAPPHAGPQEKADALLKALVNAKRPAPPTSYEDVYIEDWGTERTQLLTDKWEIDVGIGPGRLLTVGLPKGWSPHTAAKYLWAHVPDERVKSMIVRRTLSAGSRTSETLTRG